MTSDVDSHRFNNDLLLAASDRDHAARKYPTILHVLNHPELRDLFSIYDEPANRAKRVGRTVGLCAIGLVFVALVIASVEQLAGHGDDTASILSRLMELATVLALLSAGTGIFGVLIGGMGMLYSTRKRHWLYQRLMTERLRQFYFQTFVFRTPEILESLKSDEANVEYLKTRDIWFATFKHRFVGKLDSEFTKAVSDEDTCSLHDDRKKPSKIKDANELEPLFSAYRELRIEHQIGFANYKLADDKRMFSSEPRSQAALLSIVGFLSVIGLCVVHVLVLLLVVFAPLEWARISVVLGCIAIWCALIALASRAIEQGLQPEREIERYQRYRSALKTMIDRFDDAGNATEKLQIMYEIEQLSCEEMRDFLRIHDKARFVM